MTAQSALLERSAELATIESALDAAFDEDGRLLLIEGEAGAGKTSLVVAGAGRAGERGMRVLRGRGGELERDFSYGVARQLFEPTMIDASARADLLRGSAAMAAAVFDSTAGPLLDPRGVEHGLYWLVAELASRGPLALLVDDAQWADTASLRALVYLGRRVEGLPVVLALAIRSGGPSAADRLLDELRREPGAISIRPQPLSAAAVGELAEAALGATPSPRLVEASRVASAGNPFLVVELLRALAGSGAASAEESVERIERLAAAGVSDAILARVARVGDGALAVAQAISVLEPDADQGLIGDVTGIAPDEVADACERLRRAGLLGGGPGLGFAHPLVRAAVYEDLGGPRREALHAECARALRERGGDREAVVANLMLARPGGEHWAVDMLLEAAAASPAEAAIGYVRRALREPPPEEMRGELRALLGELMLRNGDHSGIAVVDAEWRRARDPELRSRIAFYLGYPLAARGEAGRAMSIIEQAIADVGGPADPRAYLLRSGSAFMAMMGLEEVPPGALLAEGEEVDGATTGERALLNLNAGLLSLGAGSVERAATLARRALADRDALEADVMDLGIAPLHSSYALTVADAGGEAEEFHDIWIELARRRGVLNSVGTGFWVRAMDRALEGSLIEAAADIEAVPELIHAGLPLIRCMLGGTMAAIQVQRGDFAAAAELIAWGEGGMEVPAGLPGALVLCGRGGLALAEGRPGPARDDFRAAAGRVEFLPYANPEVLPWRIGLAEAETTLGDRDEAKRLAVEALDAARAAGGARGIGIATRALGVATGGEDGVELLRESVETLAGTRARLQLARAQVDLGSALRRANSRREAREPLRDGLDLAHVCGAVPLAERARVELEAAGARPRRIVRSGVDALTPSELRVARLAAEGATNREIAQQLFVTAKTVETHLGHAYRKLDVAGRGELGPALRV